MTHTPGPWQFTANMYGIDNMRVFGVEKINDGFTQGVANCGYGEGCEANARLIATAPELLEALKESLPLLIASYWDWAEPHGVLHRPGMAINSENENIIFNVTEKVKEVIFKATGEQHG